jgi:hypothetical protein
MAVEGIQVDTCEVVEHVDVGELAVGVVLGIVAVGDGIGVGAGDNMAAWGAGDTSIAFEHAPEAREDLAGDSYVGVVAAGIRHDQLRDSHWI